MRRRWGRSSGTPSKGEGQSLDELRAIQDFTVRYQLNSMPGVAEVASVGGFVREYQVDVDPAKLRVYDLPLSAVYAAIAASNMSVGGKAIVRKQHRIPDPRRRLAARA